MARTRRIAQGRGAPGRARVPREFREPEMLLAAGGLFSERGYAAVTMDEIASACGVTKPLLYSYFGSKEALFAACAEQAGAQLRARLRELVPVADRPPDQRVWRGLLAVFEFVEHHRRSWRLLYPPAGRPMGEIGAGADRAREAMARDVEALMADTARQNGLPEAASGQLAPLARTFTDLTIAAASDWAERAEEPKEVAAVRLMNLTWMGFGDMLEGRMWLPPGPDT
jgi:AcrR family transcriptional regulator